MLHGVGHVDARAIDSDFLESVVQYPPGRADERLALDVLPIAGLLADQHHPGPGSAIAKHRLGRVFPEVARPARGGGLT